MKRITKSDATNIKKAIQKSLFSLTKNEKRYVNIFLGIITVNGEHKAYDIINSILAN